MSQQEEKFRKNVAELRIAIAAVDVALFTIVDSSLHIYLIPIHKPPHYLDSYGLPGGVIGVNETADEAAGRHLKSKVHVEGIHIEQLYTFSDPERDKRSRSISIAYIALASSEQFPKEDTTEGKWYPIKKLPKLAYDHNEIIAVATDRLKGKVIYTNIVANLLPKQFTLAELQNMYEIILNRKLDKRNFVKKMLSIGLIKEMDKQKDTSHRPAQLYSFENKRLTVVPEMRVLFR